MFGYHGVGGGGAVALIEERVLASDGVVTFADIPQTYRDLEMVIKAPATLTTTRTIAVQCNGDAGANYRGHRAVLAAAPEAAVAYTAQTYARAGSHTGVSGSVTRLYIPDYAGSQPKALHSQSASELTAGSWAQFFYYFCWDSTAPITSLFVDSVSANLLADTILSLYGVGSR